MNAHRRREVRGRLPHRRQQPLALLGMHAGKPGLFTSPSARQSFLPQSMHAAANSAQARDVRYHRRRVARMTGIRLCKSVHTAVIVLPMSIDVIVQP